MKTIQFITSIIFGLLRVYRDAFFGMRNNSTGGHN